MAGVLTGGLLICSDSMRSGVRDCGVSLGPRPGEVGGAPLENQALELPTVLGARDVTADAMDEMEGGPRFPDNANSG